MQDLFMRLTLDTICKIGFGVNVGSLSPLLQEVPFAKAFDECSRLIIRRYIDTFWKVKRALNIGAEAQLRKKIHVLDSFLYNIIETRHADMDAAKALGQSEVIRASSA
jgi:cytochrome P450